MSVAKRELLNAIDATEKCVFDAIYSLEDARVVAERTGDQTLCYFVEMALLHARNLVGCKDEHVTPQ